MEIALAEGEPEEGGVAHVDVDDVKAEADRLRGLDDDAAVREEQEARLDGPPQRVHNRDRAPLAAEEAPQREHGDPGRLRARRGGR